MPIYNSTKGNEKQEEKLEAEVAVKWTGKKRRADMLEASYERLGYDKRAERLHWCGQTITFAFQPGQRAKLRQVWFCRDRLCPMCNWRRSLKTFGQTSDIMDELCKKDYRFIFLTLTVKNCTGDELKETIDGLLDGFASMRHKKGWKKAVLGSMRALEVTRNAKDGTWHPHLHCILAVPRGYFNNYRLYMRQKDWADLWAASCKLDYKPIVDIRTVKEKAGNSIEGRTAIGRAVAELSKYATKDKDLLGAEPKISEAGELLNAEKTFSDAGIDENVRTMLDAISGRRLLGYTGCFKEARAKLALDDAEDGDLVHIDADAMREDVAEMLITYHWRAGVYIRG